MREKVFKLIAECDEIEKNPNNLSIGETAAAVVKLVDEKLSSTTFNYSITMFAIRMYSYGGGDVETSKNRLWIDYQDQIIPAELCC